MPNWNWQDELPVPTGQSGDPRELTYRSTMLPLGSYRNADGTESPGFAWPAMITEPINALSRLAENSRLPDGRIGIPNPQNSENQQDAMTLLYSMYGGNALNGLARGAARAPMAAEMGFDAASGLTKPKGHLGSGAENSTFSSRNAMIYDPPMLPRRAFEADYPSGARADEQGRLTIDIDGNPLGAKYIAGRRFDGGMDEAISPTELDAITEKLFGTRFKGVASAEIGGDAGRFTVRRGNEGPEYDYLLNRGLLPEQDRRVKAHELAHGIDYLTAGKSGIQAEGITRELGQVYHDLNDGSWRRGKDTPKRYKTSPESNGYRASDVAAENMAEAIRAYMVDPNYIKTVAPKTAARIREYVNENPRLNSVIQFNSGTGRPSLMGAALAAEQSDQQSLLELLGYDARNVF